MMDDRSVWRVRPSTEAGFTDTIVLAYAAKYASGFYGPFREAVESSLVGDRATYQQDPADAVEALREIELDLDEGADIVMVKPALPNLDVVRRPPRSPPCPSPHTRSAGRPELTEAAAERGWFDRRRCALETLTSIKRAGAQITLTAAPCRQAAGWLGARRACRRRPASTPTATNSTMPTRRPLVIAVAASESDPATR